MAEETLLSAARRVSRFSKIDEAHGGMSSIDTLRAIETMDKEIHRETARLAAEARLAMIRADARDESLASYAAAAADYEARGDHGSADALTMMRVRPEN